MAQAVTSYEIRPIQATDTDLVLALINDDRITGQPQVTSAMLDDALSGRSGIDSGWWEELSKVVTQVALTRAGRTAGVISYATRARDRAGLILWLHAREEPNAIGSLLDHAMLQLSDCPVLEAFSFASALGAGLEALPVRHRPETHTALLARGFVFEDLWRYMHRTLPADLPTTSYQTVMDDDTRKLQALDGTTVIAEATIGLPAHGIGVLWWISVQPSARGRGLGRKLLGSALDLLTRLGALEVILYVDDDEPAGERDRSAANRLYDQAGFVEVDRLYSYKRKATTR